MYLDDCLLCYNNLDLALDSIIQIRSDLKEAGLIVNEEKSNWLPTHQVTWLGFILNAQNNFIQVPEEKLKRIQNKIVTCLTAKKLSARQMAQLVGKINSLYIALGNIVFVLTKNCQRWLSSSSAWDKKAKLDHDSRLELEFWKENLYCMPCKAYEKPKPVITRICFH